MMTSQLTLLLVLTTVSSGFVLKHDNSNRMVVQSQHDDSLDDTTPPALTEGSTTPQVPYEPCNGRIALLLDTSKSLTQQEFDDQNSLVAQKLFAPDYFNHYERLALGYYGRFAQLNWFDSLLSEKEISDFVNQVRLGKTDAVLRRALFYLSIANLTATEQFPVTAVVFVSNINDKQVADNKAVAQQLRDQGVRLVLVAHGDNVSVELLAQIAGDSSLVFEWKSDEAAPANYKQWFKQIIGCSAE